jgi:hypothetical protein
MLMMARASGLLSRIQDSGLSLRPTRPWPSQLRICFRKLQYWVSTTCRCFLKTSPATCERISLRRGSEDVSRQRIPSFDANDRSQCVSEM